MFLYYYTNLNFRSKLFESFAVAQMLNWFNMDIYGFHLIILHFWLNFDKKEDEKIHHLLNNLK